MQFGRHKLRNVREERRRRRRPINKAVFGKTRRALSLRADANARVRFVTPRNGAFGRGFFFVFFLSSIFPTHPAGESTAFSGHGFVSFVNKSRPHTRVLYYDVRVHRLRPVNDRVTFYYCCYRSTFAKITRSAVPNSRERTARETPYRRRGANRYNVHYTSAAVSNALFYSRSFVYFFYFFPFFFFPFFYSFGRRVRGINRKLYALKGGTVSDVISE